MNKLGKSIERYTNGGAKFAFWTMNAIILFFIGLFIFVETDSMGKTLILIVIPFFIALNVYMFFKAKTEVDLKEHGMYIRTLSKQHEVLYDEIAKFDKTMRVGKSGAVVVVFYLLIIEKKDGERITFPFRINEEFLEKLAKMVPFNA